LDLDLLIDRALPFFESKGYTLDHSDRSRLMLSTARERSTLLPDLVDYCEIFLQFATLEGADLGMINSESSQAVLKTLLQLLYDHDPQSVDELNDMIAKIQTELSIKGKLLIPDQACIDQASPWS
jgi:hypothetical protein